MSSHAAPPALVDDAAAPSAESSVVDDVPAAGLDTPAANDQTGRRSTADVVELDAGSIDLARAAAVCEAGIADHVGDFVSAVAEDDIAVTASFSAQQAGYFGWHWSVTLAVLPDGPATVSEVVLLPGEGSLLAPAWIPWDQRIRAGDVGVGDLLPPIDDDPRLVPAYVQSDDPAVEAVAHELGIGRVHVLSREGRVDFADRLHDSVFGPTGEIALAAPAHCFSCAFYLPLAGSLGQLVGACSNEYSPADGRVVDAEFGCGAHSETVIEMPARSAATLAVIDELSLEVHRRPVPANAPAATVDSGEVVTLEVDTPDGNGTLAGGPTVDSVEMPETDEANPEVDSTEVGSTEVDSTEVDSTEIDSTLNTEDVNIDDSAGAVSTGDSAGDVNTDDSAGDVDIDDSAGDVSTGDSIDGDSPSGD